MLFNVLDRCRAVGSEYNREDVGNKVAELLTLARISGFAVGASVVIVFDAAGAGFAPGCFCVFGTASTFATL